MAFFLWFKENKAAVMATSAVMVVLIFALAVLPGNGDAALGLAGNSRASKMMVADVQVSRGSSISRDDLILMARVIEGEAADEPYIGKVAVGAVILNRTRSGDFPHTIRGVIYQPDAFEAVTNGQYLRPLTQESIAAAREAASGHDPTGGALYYWNPAKARSTWVWSRPIITQIGNHVFAR
ncbi:cell wall hydrolase [Desulfofundulus thermosubterraneus]|uniref:Cell Wall Hydrolase n=1 Tax=Desulfofundulus thermosubterraneus DSM 16057 TaxID=1121432 RepID=A0A1M6IHQ5_9FIRM|nr:cell wall hydrolase [Desulfofundulus thermosubterraneus]SHJ33953.1 Cell Wall Hydrolase [Desulfofundulus thermosubterraneus DSM 16057]